MRPPSNRTGAMASVDSGSDSDSDSSNGADTSVDWLSVVRGQPSAGVVHDGFFCDGCADGGSEPRPIVGVRYSRHGDEYDLCSACYSQLPPKEQQRYAALTEAVPVDEIDGDNDTESEDDDTTDGRDIVPAASTSSLDKKISNLEALLDREDSSSDDSDDESDAVSVAQQINDIDGTSDVAAVPELERIQPLSQESLPEFYRKTKVRKGNAAAAEAAVSAAAAAIVYEKAEKRSLYCRVCKKQFETVEELRNHRVTPEHKAAEDRDRDGSYCPLCDKQFTSPEQLREHVQGKWHQAREAAALKGEKFVAPGKKKAKRRSTSKGKVSSSRAPGGGTLAAKMLAANAPPAQKKPLVVRFGTETGGQIKVKGQKKVLAGLREKPPAKPTGVHDERVRDSKQRQEMDTNRSDSRSEHAPSSKRRKEKKSRKRERPEPAT